MNKHKSNKIKENSNTVRHLNNGTDHRHSKSCCDQSSPARRTIKKTVTPSLSVSNIVSHWLGTHTEWFLIEQRNSMKSKGPNRDQSALVYTPFTQGTTFVPPLCDHKIGQVAVEGRREAERLPWSFKGGTQDVQTSPWSPWSFEHVQNSRTKVAEEIGRSRVAQRRQEEGTRIAVVAEWVHSGRPLVAP